MLVAVTVFVVAHVFEPCKAVQVALACLEMDCCNNGRSMDDQKASCIKCAVQMQQDVATCNPVDCKPSTKATPPSVLQLQERCRHCRTITQRPITLS